LIRSSQRTLQIIVEGRNLNFKEEDELRESSQENILYFSQFSSNLQSILPRLGSMAVVGSAGSITFAQIFNDVLKDLPGYTFPLIIALADGIGYLLHGLVVIPTVKRLLQREKIRADYDRNLYYDQYYERSRNALATLFIALEECHNSFFGNKYHGENMSAHEAAEMSIEGARPTMCYYVYKHMNAKKITPDLWPMCETGRGVKECRLYKEEKKQEERGPR
jgi:hypothetical protein